MSGFFWFPTAVNAWALAIEASAVVSLRTAKFSTGDADANKEAVRMVGEKLEAAFALQLLGMSVACPGEVIRTEC